jgi:hypothetical protein
MAYTYKGKTYKTKALMQKAQGDVKGTPTKNKGSFFDKFIKGDKFKKKAPASNVDSGRGGKDSARQKMYDKTSMFAKSAKNRDDAKARPGKARSFKEAFDDATKQGKDRFMLKGKSYLTTKGKRADRFPVTTDKKKPADKKLNIFQKFTKKMRGTNADGSTRTQKEFEAAREKRKNNK